MLAVKSMDVRDNFKSLCDKVFKGETLIVPRPKNENIVLAKATADKVVHRCFFNNIAKKSEAEVTKNEHRSI